MDGSVRQASDEGRKGPHEALFLTPPRRPYSPRREPIVDRRAAAAAHHSPRGPEGSKESKITTDIDRNFFPIDMIPRSQISHQASPCWRRD